MGDEFDGCECVWSHELAMQRLLNFVYDKIKMLALTPIALTVRTYHSILVSATILAVLFKVSGRLRQSDPTTGGDDTNFTMMTMLMVFALIMYLIKPGSIMKLTKTSKRNGQDPRDNGGPPSPPAVN